MDIILENITLPEKGRVEIALPRAFEIKVTAEGARRMVNRWLLNEVTIQMSAHKPTLVVMRTRAMWRVPVELSFPHTGPVGVVGTVDVDVETGETQDLTERKTALIAGAMQLKPLVPPYEPKRETPAEYLAKDVPPARKLVIAEDGKVRLAPAKLPD